MNVGAGIARTALPMGFLASGVNSGVRKYRPDVGIIISERAATAAGVFTKNECKAAPILYCQELLPSTNVRAVITNSGQANAATGAEGAQRNLKLARATASAVGCTADQVLVASTGVIGVQVDLDKIVPALPDLVERACDAAEPFAVAILTTDLVPKTVTTEVKLSEGRIRITGICKGSGMIHPNMATMLGYLLTDAALEPDVAQTMLKEAVDVSFNMISVDGDTSTNDAVFLLANGASGVKVERDADVRAFRKALTETAIILAKSIAKDGEGATKLVEATITGLPDLALARKAARGLTLSPLLKCALHSGDPNWGRILARLGAEGVPTSSLARLTLTLQGTCIFAGGEPALFDREELRKLLKRDFVRIEAAFNSGKESATAWGCDLSARYVEINAEYST